MKTIILSATLVFAVAASAETLDFEAHLDGAHAVPPTQSGRTVHAFFTLDDANNFHGYGWFDLGYSARVPSIKIYESSEAAVIGAPRFDFVLTDIELPGGFPVSPGGERFDVTAQITAADRLALLSGNWWMNAATAEFPSGEMRGQITIVPEPSTFALLGTGIAAFALLNRRTFWR